MFLTLLQQQAAAGSVTVTPGVGSLTLTGFAPTVSAEQNVSVIPGIGALVLTGFAPTVSVGTSVTVTPGTGSLALTGYAPTVTVPVSVTVTPGTGALVLQGYPPTVSTGAVQEEVVFDGHDGRPRIDWEAPSRRARRERELIRQAVRTAMQEASGELPKADPGKPVTVARAPDPLSKDRRLQIAQTLIGRGEVQSPDAGVDKLARTIARIEKSVQRQIQIDLESARQLAIEQEIEDEDEMILLLAA